MQLLIIRHGIAEEASDWALTGKSDDERPLTDEGRREMTLNAKGIRHAAGSVDLLASSPLVRARQTAQLVADAFDMTRLEMTKSLAPGTPPSVFVEWLERHSDKDVIAAVGHEPHLGELATWLLTGTEESHIDLEKGGACLIAFEGVPSPGEGRLRWAIAPAQLRALGES